MKKLVFTILIGFSFAQTQAQDAATLIPFLTEMIAGISSVNNALQENEEQLSEIKGVMSTVKDFDEFAQKAIAVRESINSLACLAENMNEMELGGFLDRIGAPRTNLFSDFMTCQYDIYYSTLDIDYRGIISNVDRIFSKDEQMDFPARAKLIDETVKKIESIRMRTVRTKGALLMQLEKQVRLKDAEEYLTLINKI